LPDGDDFALPLRDVGAAVGRVDGRQPPPAEVRLQVLPDAPLELVERAPVVDLVLVHEVRTSFLETQFSGLVGDGHAVEDCRFAALQRVARVVFDVGS
jgi:hypothetical protein